MLQPAAPCCCSTPACWRRPKPPQPLRGREHPQQYPQPHCYFPLARRQPKNRPPQYRIAGMHALCWLHATRCLLPPSDIRPMCVVLLQANADRSETCPATIPQEVSSGCFIVQTSMPGKVQRIELAKPLLHHSQQECKNFSFGCFTVPADHAINLRAAAH